VRRLVLAALLLAVVVVVAGCGAPSDRRPCDTPERMTSCIADIARYTATLHGLKASVVRASCAREGQIWSCLVLAPSFSGKVCGRIAVRVTPETGLPYPGDGVYKPLSVCKQMFEAPA
jgi:hypothetical protein